jgi:hypothetical protein
MTRKVLEVALNKKHKFIKLNFSPEELEAAKRAEFV